MNAQPKPDRPFNAQPDAPPQTAAPQAADSRSAADPSLGVLLKQLAHEVPSLLSKEVALAKSELRENLQTAKEGVAAVSTGGAVVLGGFVIVLLSAVYALSNVMAPWLAALLVGAAAMVVGFLMVSAGRKKFEGQSLRPDQTIDSLRKDKDAIRGETP